MTAVLYIVLGVLVVGLVAAQTWIARSSEEVAGSRGPLVLAIRILNIVLMIAAIALAAYTLLTGR